MIWQDRIAALDDEARRDAVSRMSHEEIVSYFDRLAEKAGIEILRIEREPETRPPTVVIEGSVADPDGWDLRHPWRRRES